MTWFHGTRDPESVLSGIRFDVPRKHDPGDFGWGFYCSSVRARAATYGPVLQVEVELSEFAHIDNPYFLDRLSQLTPVTPEEKLLYGIIFADGPDDMLTVRGPDRKAVAQMVRTEFLHHGWKGIISEPLEELVVFDESAVVSVEAVPGGVR